MRCPVCNQELDYVQTDRGPYYAQCDNDLCPSHVEADGRTQEFKFPAVSLTDESLLYDPWRSENIPGELKEGVA